MTLVSRAANRPGRLGFPADGKPSVEYKVEGEESMGNGSTAHSGRASATEGAVGEAVPDDS